MTINIITVGGTVLNSITGYTLSDVGARVNRMKAVGSNTIYYNDKGYRDGFKEIKVDGADLKATVDIIKNLYTAGNPVSFIDLYGKTYNGLITNFDSAYVKTTGAYNYSFGFIVFPTAGAVDTYLFRVGGTLLNVVESCSVDDRGNSHNILNMADGTVGYQINTYTANIFNINISGIELVTDGIGDFTSTLTNGALIEIVLPNGKKFRGLLVSKNISLLEGNNNFQNYTISFIAGTYTGSGDDTPPVIRIIDNAGNNLNTLYESYNIRVASERYTKHNTFQGIVVQQLPPENDDKEISISYLQHKDGIDPAPSGTIVDIVIGSITFHGIVTERTENPLENCINVNRININLIVIPE